MCLVCLSFLSWLTVSNVKYLRAFKCSSTGYNGILLFCAMQIHVIGESSIRALTDLLLDDLSNHKSGHFSKETFLMVCGKRFLVYFTASESMLSFISSIKSFSVHWIASQSCWPLGNFPFCFKLWGLQTCFKSCVEYYRWTNFQLIGQVRLWTSLGRRHQDGFTEYGFTDCCQLL